MADILVSIDQRANMEMLAKFPKRIAIATARAINRALGSGRTVLVKAVAGETGLKSKDVRDAMRIKEATSVSLVGELAASIKRIPLIQFRARGRVPSRGRGNGVSYRLASGRGNHPHAFIATVGKGGHTGVFVREGKARLPIKQLYGPSIGAVFAKFKAVGQARADEVLKKNLDHELAFASLNLDVTSPSSGDVDAE